MLLEQMCRRHPCSPSFAGGDQRSTHLRSVHHRSAMVFPRCAPLDAGPGFFKMRLFRLLLPALALMTLGACAVSDNYQPKGEPSFYRNLAQPGAELDAAAAASMITGYRANNGLPAVTLDPELMRLAQAQADTMAKRDKLDHSVGKPFTARIKQAGYGAKGAAINTSAGHLTLAEADACWRDSPPRRANLLLKGATRIGIAAVYTPRSKYKVYWAMVIAEPDDRRLSSR